MLNSRSDIRKIFLIYFVDTLAIFSSSADCAHWRVQLQCSCSWNVRKIPAYMYFLVGLLREIRKKSSQLFWSRSFLVFVLLDAAGKELVAPNMFGFSASLVIG